MNQLVKIIFLFTIGMTVISCTKNDNNTEPLRNFTEQYTKDLASIETYLHTHYIDVVNNPGSTDDQDVTYTLIPPGGTQTSIWDQTTYPLQTRLVTVKQNDINVTYTIYYLKLRVGSGPNSKSPSNVDRVFTSYRGEYIYSSTETVAGASVTTIKSTEFEELINPQSYFNLTGVIRGWSEIFPQFTTGSYIGNTDGTVTYNDFGAGVMFLPSGLAYFSSPQAGIPAYSPLIFNFKLYEIQRVDHDADGIYSYQEDLNNDGYVLTLPEGVANPDNTNAPGTAFLISTSPDRYSDEDEVPDFLDADDDGDFFTTASEIKNSVTGEDYPFNDIPNCGGTGNGKKKHLDPSCH